MPPEKDYIGIMAGAYDLDENQEAPHGEGPGTDTLQDAAIRGIRGPYSVGPGILPAQRSLAGPQAVTLHTPSSSWLSSSLSSARTAKCTAIR